jgi:hypothetical protein
MPATLAITLSKGSRRQLTDLIRRATLRAIVKIAQEVTKTSLAYNS